MGLREIRYDMNHGAARRLLMPTLERWAASHPLDAEVLEVGAGHYDHRPYFSCTLTKFDADTSQNPDMVGDAHAMPMQDDRFDAALAISVLEHVDDPYQVVREMFRVLKPGAPVLAWIPFTFGVHGFPEDVSRFTTFGMRRLFERAGFEVVRIDEKPYSGAFLQLSNSCTSCCRVPTTGAGCAPSTRRCSWSRGSAIRSTSASASSSSRRSTRAPRSRLASLPPRAWGRTCG